MNTEETTTGNQLTILLLLIPAAALVFAYREINYFIPPADFKSFFLFSVGTTSIACLLLFFLSFWKCKKNKMLVMIFLTMEVFWGFAGVALLPIVNVKYDLSETKVYEKRLLQIYDAPYPPPLVRVEPWGNPSEWLEIPKYKLAGAQPLKSLVRFTTRKGRLGFEYVTSIEIKKAD